MEIQEGPKFDCADVTLISNIIHSFVLPSAVDVLGEGSVVEVRRDWDSGALYWYWDRYRQTEALFDYNGKPGQVHSVVVSESGGYALLARVKLGGDMKGLEEQIEEKGLTAPRITLADIEAVIEDEQYLVSKNSTLTICVLTLRNGFTVTGESACVSPENYDAEVGRNIARDKAKDKVWPLLGFMLADVRVGNPIAKMLETRPES